MSGAVRELEPAVVRSRRPPPPPPPPPRGVPLWLVAVAVTVAIIMLGFVFTSPGDEPDGGEPIDAAASPTLVAPVESTSFEPPPPPWAAEVVSLSPEVLTWRVVDRPDFAAGDRVLAVACDRHTLVAAGTSSGAPAMWASSSGTGWTATLLGDNPSFGPDAGILYVAVGHDGIYAAGSVEATPALWFGRRIHDMRRLDVPTDIVGFRGVAPLGSGVAVLTAREEGGLAAALISADGGWSEYDVPELEGAEVVGLESTAFGVIAVGADCRSDPCSPALWISQDGAAWRRVTLQGMGRVHAVTEAGDGLVAVGRVGDSPRPAVWSSVDGSSWAGVPEQRALRTPAVSVRLVETRVDLAGYRAGVEVNGVRHDLLQGDDIGGRIVASEIGAEGVVLTTRDEVLGAQTARVMRLDGESPEELIEGFGELWDVTAVGDRVAATGVLRDPFSAQIVGVWTSLDGGITWTMTPLPGATTDFVQLSMHRGSLVAIDVGGSPPTVWRGSWDTTPEIHRATVTVERFASAVSAGDVDTLVALLEPHPAQTPAEREVWWPSLGLVEPGRLTSLDGDFDLEKLAVIAAYSRRLGARYELDDCHASVRLDHADTATVACTATVADRLSQALEVGQVARSVVFTVAGDRITDLAITTSDGGWPWAGFVRWATPAHPETARTFDVVDEEAMRALPTSAAAADEHVALAQELAASLLRTGRVTEIATPFGLMRWEVVALDTSAHVGEVVTGDPGFYLSTWGDFGPGPVLYSEDGRSWGEAGVPTSSGEGRVMATGWGPVYADYPAAWIEGAGGWQSFDLEVPATGQWWINAAAATEDVLVLVGNADAGGPVVWRGDRDLRFSVVAAPWASGDPMGEESWGWVSDVAATSRHILAMVWRDEGNELWVSPDGLDWTPVGGPGELGMVTTMTAGAIGDRFVVVGYGNDQVCRASAWEGSVCGSNVIVATSQDGRRWRSSSLPGPIAEFDFSRVVTGSLGAFAHGWGSDPAAGPRLWMSPDGMVWHPLPLVLDGAAVGEMGIQSMAVGDDAVVIAVSQWSPLTESETSFLVVGRLVDAP